jgi:hypothetical protein
MMAEYTQFQFVTDTELEMVEFTEALAKLHWNYDLREFGTRYYELTINDLGLLEALSLLEQIPNKPALTCVHGVIYG